MAGISVDVGVVPDLLLAAGPFAIRDITSDFLKLEEGRLREDAAA
jgi:hypothetical protein